jgi:hypothetical protein
MKKILLTIFILLFSFAGISQEVEDRKNAISFHGGIGIPLLLSTSGNRNSELFQISKSLWNLGLGFCYSREFTENWSYSIYIEFREFDYDNEELEDYVQNKTIGYSAIRYHGEDMFLSYTSLLIGFKYTISFQKLSTDLMLLTGPTAYSLAEPTVNLREIDGNNILTFKYRDGNGIGYSIYPHISFGYKLNKMLSLQMRCSFLSSFVKIKYDVNTNDLKDYKFAESLESEQRLISILTGIGFKLEF